MAQLEAIRHEIRSISIMNPGPLTRRLMDNPDQDNPDSGGTANVGPLNVSGESTAAGDNQVKHKQSKQDLPGVKMDASVFKEHGSVASGTSNLYSQATAYAKLAESPALKPGTMEGSVSMGTMDDRPGLLSVLPVSAESAGLLPNRQGIT
ncbi:Myosin-IIIb [Bienertia sinuspersici]